jgi:DNA-binding transcriptional ArsR family regulator
MTALHQSKDAAIAATEKLKIFAQPQRLMILSLLSSGEFTVTEIDAATAIGQPALSQQLAALRRADVVDTRRDGKQIFYRLANDMIGACVNHIEALFGATQAAPALPPKAKPPSRPPLTPSLGAAAFAKVF